MRHAILTSAVAVLAVSLSSQAKADTYQFGFGGPWVSGNVALSYGTATDKRYSQGFEVLGASGTFSDAALGLQDAAISGLVPVNYATPEPGNLLTPYDFSRFAVATGTQHGSLSFDNLLYPNGSPQTATSYPFHGGFLDIYGLLLTLGNGDVVNVWSNGVEPGELLPDYGVTVATSAAQLDSVGGGVSVTPEPGTFLLLGTGVLGALVWRRP